MPSPPTDYHHRNQREIIPPGYSPRRREMKLPDNMAHHSPFHVQLQPTLEEISLDEEDFPVLSIFSTLSQEVDKEEAELVGESHPCAPYFKEKGLYVVGHKPACTVIGLRRSSESTSAEIPFLPLDDLTLLATVVQEQKPYSVFLIDASYQDTISGVDTIVRETAQNRLYLNHRSLFSVVEKGVEGLISKLQQRYARTPFRFIEARKYGNDVIDAQVFGQPQY